MGPIEYVDGYKKQNPRRRIQKQVPDLYRVSESGALGLGFHGLKKNNEVSDQWIGKILRFSETLFATGIQGS